MKNKVIAFGLAFVSTLRKFQQCARSILPTLLLKRISLLLTKPGLSIGLFAISLFGASAQDDVKRTPWGKPDLNGYWDYHHLTPLQRPERFAGIAVMNEEQAKDWEDNAYNLSLIHI